METRRSRGDILRHGVPLAAAQAQTADSLRGKANEAAHVLKQLEATYADALLRVSREEGVMLEVKNNAHLESLRASNAVVNTLEEKAAVAEAALSAARVRKRGNVRRTSTHETDAKRETGGDRAPERPPNPLVDAGPRQDVNEPVGAPRPRAPRRPSLSSLSSLSSQKINLAFLAKKTRFPRFPRMTLPPCSHRGGLGAREQARARVREGDHVG